MKKSSAASCEKSEELYRAVMERLPGTRLVNRSITTSSIYCRTPDGYSLRIGDHKGREKYSYKWNLGPQYSERGQWIKEENRIDGRAYWRFYTSSVERLAQGIEENIRRKELESISND